MLLRPEELKAEQRRFVLALQEGRFKDAVAAAEHLSSSRVASLLRDAPRGAERGLLEALPVQRASRVLTHLSPQHAAEFLRDSEPKRAARFLMGMRPSDAADVLSAMDEAARTRLLAHVPPKGRRMLESLGRYDPDSAGGVMSPHFLAIEVGTTVGDTLEAVLAAPPEIEKSAYVYVISSKGRLEGVLSLKDLVRLDPKDRVERVMVHPVLAVTVGEPAVDAARHLRNRRLTMLPVVDDEGVLVGVIPFEEAMDLLSQHVAERFTGIGGGTTEESFHTPALGSVQRRLPWMAGNVFLNLGAVAVIAGFEETIAAVVILAAFLPMITDMGGNVGIQALSVAIRSLALGEARLTDVWRSVRKETLIGLVNGAALGALFALIASLIGGNAGLALGVNVLLAGIVGGSLPFLLKRMGKDPAMMTGPVLTTVTDITGVTIYLGLATVFLGWIVL
jgi:magnesium transporter